MSCVQDIISPRLQQHKVMMKKGQPCRYCRTKVDAPGRHSEQCVPLLQTHVLQEAQQQRLDLTPRAYVAKTRESPATSSSRRPPSLGLSVPVFVLEGFWLLANRRKPLLCKCRTANPALGFADRKHPRASGSLPS